MPGLTERESLIAKAPELLQAPPRRPAAENTGLREPY